MHAPTGSRREGDDVSVGGVATYSTLGHLPDPVFSTMLRWREPRLLGTIFHELAHEQLYVADDTEFNEAYASVVATAGIRRWYAARRPSPELAEWERQEAREREFAALLAAARARLEQLYASGAPAEEMRIAKEREFGRLKFEYAQLRARWGGYAGYDAWFDRALNNAHLAAVATYEDCVPGLTRELEAAGSLPAFYRRAAAARRDAARAATCRRVRNDRLTARRPSGACAGTQRHRLPQHRTQRPWHDAEPGETVLRADRVDRRRSVVVGGERLAGHEIHDGRLQSCKRARQRQNQPPHAGGLRSEPHYVLERHDLGPAEFETETGDVGIVEAAYEGFHDVTHVYRREPRFRAGEREYARHRPEQARETIEQGIARAEHDRGPEDHVTPDRRTHPLRTRSSPGPLLRR